MKARSLAPKEHGAYGQIALPMVCALASGRPTIASALLAIASGLAFAAHEPALIVLGHRGSKAQREDGARASRRLGVLALAAAACGGAGLWLAGRDAELSAIGPIVLAIAVAIAVRLDAEKTTLGELLAAAALTGAALPVAVASGVELRAAYATWLAWAVGFAALVLGVRATIAHHKAPRSLLARVAPAIAASLVFPALAWARVVPDRIAIAAAPMSLLAIGVAAVAPETRGLRKLGWMIVAATVVVCGAIVFVVRAA